MSEALPASMITHLEKLGTALVALARTHEDASLGVLEQAVLAAVREALPGLLREVVQNGTTALRAPYVGRPHPCPMCGTHRAVQSWRPRTITTVCGPLEFSRPWYVCPSCHQGFSPVDATLEIAPMRA